MLLGNIIPKARVLDRSKIVESQEQIASFSSFSNSKKSKPRRSIEVGSE